MFDGFWIGIRCRRMLREIPQLCLACILRVVWLKFHLSLNF
jgi:hypothetical protein